MLSRLRAILSQNEFVKILFAQKTIHLVVQEQVEEKKKAKKCFACHKLCHAVCFSVSEAVHGTEHQRCVVCTAFADFVINLNLYQGRRKRTSPSKVTIWQCYFLVGFGLFGQCFRLMHMGTFVMFSGSEAKKINSSAGLTENLKIIRPYPMREILVLREQPWGVSWFWRKKLDANLNRWGPGSKVLLVKSSTFWQLEAYSKSGKSWT